MTKKRLEKLASEIVQMELIAINSAVTDVPGDKVATIAKRLAVREYAVKSVLSKYNISEKK